ncbi:MAG: hypothetical protein LUB61_04165 [Eggerthellaceae bacterium]|nr:hypothetical protein [Eggerthellaceae bacterium]
MDALLKYVTQLAQNIGARPAGTEEEQQAALYINESFQKEARMASTIEDFNFNPDVDLPKALYGALAVIAAVLIITVPFMSIVSLILSIIAAVFYACEVLGHPLLDRILRHGISQNVVTRYIPQVGENMSPRRQRKIVLVAHYDSGKATPIIGGPIFHALPILQQASFWGVIAVLVLVILHMILSILTGVPVVLFVLLVIAAVLSCLPIAGFIITAVSRYNEGANCNASGVAVMMELAARVGHGIVQKPAYAAEGPTIHGEQAAAEAGVIPEGSEIVYEIPTPPESQSSDAETRLLSAKAAVAAMSGRPVSENVNITLSDKLVQVKEPPVREPDDNKKQEIRQETFAAFSAQEMPQGQAMGQQPAEAQGQPVPPVPEEAEVTQVYEEQVIQEQPQSAQPVQTSPYASPRRQEPEVPEWFKTARKKAKKSAADTTSIHRSIYAEAMDNQERLALSPENEPAAFDSSQTEKRLQQMRENIMNASYRPQNAAQESPANAAAAQNAGRSAAVKPQEGRASRPMPSNPAPLAPANSAEYGVHAASADVSETDDTRVASGQRAYSKRFTLPIVSSKPASDINDALPRIEEVQEKVEVEETASPISPMKSEQLPKIDETISQPPRQRRRRPAASEAVPEEPATATQPKEAASPSAQDMRDVIPSIANAEPGRDALSSDLPIPSLNEQRTVAIPSIGNTGSQERLEPVRGRIHQPAPLDEQKKKHEGRPHDLNSVVPSIDLSSSQASAGSSQRFAPVTEKLSIPSILPNDIPDPTAPSEPQQAPSVATAGAFGLTGSIEPVGDELLESVEGEEIYVEDADDTDYGESITESGAFAGPGYVDMPKSRFSKLFGRFGKKGKKHREESSAQEWLDVDDDFDARTAGEKRKGWESFRDDTVTYQDSGGSSDDYNDLFGDDDDWNGGGFDRESLGRVSTLSGPESDESPTEKDFQAPSGVEMEIPQNQVVFDNGAPNVSADDIVNFHNPAFSTEIWFVALGAELAENGGMKAFLEEHSQELRGALFIDIEALGSGSLCLIDREGKYISRHSSSRMDRIVRKASSNVGMKVGKASMTWTTSAAGYALQHGYHAMHLAGMRDGKPAFDGQKDDIVENIDQETLRRNADFVMEVLKQI